MKDLIYRNYALEKLDTLKRAYLLNEPAGMGGLSAVIQCRDIIKDIPSEDQWISVNDKRPDCFGYYLTYDAETKQILALSYNPEYSSFGVYDNKVTHWRNLPLIPPEIGDDVDG